MNTIYDEQGHDAWEHCSTEELVARGLLSADELEEAFSELSSAIEAEAQQMTA